MVKKLAHKNTRELLNDTEIRENSLPKGDFSQTWQGRLFVVDPEKSQIAKLVGIEKRGEFAIKVR